MQEISFEVNIIYPLATTAKIVIHSRWNIKVSKNCGYTYRLHCSPYPQVLQHPEEIPTDSLKERSDRIIYYSKNSLKTKGKNYSQVLCNYF